MAVIGFEWNQADDIVNHLKLQEYKTLILSNGEYKKFNEGNEDVVIVSNQNAIPKMTSNTSPSGEVSASSTHTSYTAYKAFDDIISEGTNRWVALTNTGWLQYEFPNKISIAKYRMMSFVANQLPTEWTFEGSNDGASWTILDTQKNVTDWKVETFKEFLLSNTERYKMYRLNVSKNNGSDLLGVAEMEMFELISYTPASTPSWQTVSTTLPSSEQFQEEGMENLAIFDRGVQPVLNSPIQMTNEGVLGEGKVFKAKVDLKKYFDLRKLEVK